MNTTTENLDLDTWDQDIIDRNAEWAEFNADAQARRDRLTQRIKDAGRVKGGE